MSNRSDTGSDVYRRPDRALLELIYRLLMTLSEDVKAVAQREAVMKERIDQLESWVDTIDKHGPRTPTGAVSPVATNESFAVALINKPWFPWACALVVVLVCFFLLYLKQTGQDLPIPKGAP